MMRRFAPKAIALLAVGAFTGWLLRAADTVTPPAPATENTRTATAKPLAPGPNDSQIAYIVAGMLRQNHYLKQPFNDEISEKFFDRYFEELDGQHMFFTQGDLNEFASYRTNLDNLTVQRSRQADTTPGYKIFTRLIERHEQRVAYVLDLLKNEKFEFTTDERIPVTRRDAPYPKDLDEAKQLWRQRVRFEYLEEKLGRASAKVTVTNLKTNGPVAKLETSATNQTAKVEGKKKTDHEEIVEKLTKRYNTTLHYYKELDSDDVLERYLTALAHVYDPHSDYMNSGGAANFAIGMNLALFGIGAELRSEDGYCTITKLQPGPAMKSKKINAEDKIIAVAQSNAPPVDVVDMNLNKVVQLIRGPKGTEVRLTIIPKEDSSERRIVSLIRDEIKLEDQEAKAKVIDLPDGKNGNLRLGVIDLPSFYATIDLSGRKGNDPSTRTTSRSTTADVARLLKKMTAEKIDGVILDLRRNGGGSLEEATALASLFIKGPVVQVRSPNHEVFPLEDPSTPVLYTGPLVVLTSRGSASAAEIVAGALQDYGRALVVGDISTFGKGTVQNLNPLRAYVEPATPSATNDPGALKVTIRKYYRPSGTSTLFKGVLPDIVLPAVANYMEDVGEAALDDLFGNHYAKLENTSSGKTLGRDTIESLPFDKLDLVQSFVADLLKKSTARIATNQDFAYLREDIEHFRKLQADKTISLNEAERLKERAENEARQKARDNERRSRKESPVKTYELRLSQVNLPGLPPPVSKSDDKKDEAALKHDYTEPGNASVVSIAKPRAETGTQPGNISTDKPNEAAPDKVVAGTKPAKAADATVKAEDKEEEAPPAVDATLEEAENILVDYIRLRAQKDLLSSKQ